MVVVVAVTAKTGSLVMVCLPGTIVEGHFGTILRVEPKRQRWPELYVVLMDMDFYDPELVDELHLTAGEIRVIG